MSASLQNRINPPKVQAPLSISDAKMTETISAEDSNGGIEKVDFKSVLMNSNDEVFKERAAKSNGDLSNVKNYDDFLQNLNESTHKKRTPKNELGKDDFLKLFITQLQNQDPLKPKDGAEMASQLAQFNSLEQMMNFNKGLEKLEQAQTASQSMNYLNYVGKEVSVNGGRVKLSEKGIGNVKFDVSKDLVSTNLEVRDSGGTLVATKNLGNMSSGTHKLGWDGLGKDGARLPNASYSFSISGTDIRGEEVPVDITTKVRITGVDMGNGESEFYSTLGKLKIGDIAAVGEKGFDSDSSANSVNAKTSATSSPIQPSGEKNTTSQLSDKTPETLVKEASKLQPIKKKVVADKVAVKTDKKLPDQPFHPETPGVFGYQKASEPNFGQNMPNLESSPKSVSTPKISQQKPS